MAACTFFGHRDYNGHNDELLAELKRLILNKGVDTFFVGNQGNFDYAALKALRKLQIEMPHIRYSVVLAYHPSVKGYSDFIGSEETVFPEEMERVL